MITKTQQKLLENIEMLGILQLKNLRNIGTSSDRGSTCSAIELVPLKICVQVALRHGSLDLSQCGYEIHSCDRSHLVFNCIEVSIVR